MTLVKFNPAKNASSVNPWFTDVFESVFNDSLMTDRLVSRVPAVNIAETEADFQIELAVPGMQKEDFKIAVDKNVLTINAEKKSEQTEGKKYSKREYNYTSFVRSFTLPDTIDHSKIEAAYTDGILKLTIAKKEEAKVQSREIAVK
ncbi:Hsp20/alpha crystallin family protein [uncultured Mucilaginibacter sp.]|uniref:Hsp20/alpha crystallin family protein n=1 Tax=uncultured Mucilaginibacter sp. TaxID=797541 RepID=UPI0026337BEE|nr:Hsp20/alpha crystallin family protein [uncultured Mucilaginibacter sp.]